MVRIADHAILILLLSFILPAVADAEVEVRDERLKLTMLAEHPDIVTPVGMAIDRQDRIYAIESHTHLAPEDYDGPPHDVIKVFQANGEQGSAKTPFVFAQGLTAAMNLAFSPDGILYAVCAREVIAMPDRDGDGRCDELQRILTLKTSERYPHNSLLGITFDRHGWLYVARGNISSRKYRFEGLDDSFVAGYGDGGNIVRCRPDGSQIQEFATGFWNPFDIKFDVDGRLLCVDNDPDARGPNRLMHIVRGGDYGYRSLFGGGGNHPYQGWDGSLPGTLPMISGTGEAPSGVIDCRRLSFPVEYRNGILVTVWNENTIELHKTVAAGSSLRATREVLVSGPNDFRPVALDCDSNGNLYFTDWVLVDYPNHGQGRIWKLSTQDGVEQLEPIRQFEKPASSVASTPAKTESVDILIDRLTSSDPFARHAAGVALSAREHHPALLRATHHSDARIRLGALLALKRGRCEQAASVASRLLSDPDSRVRQAALIWIGESGWSELRDELIRSIETDDVSAQLLETYIATVEVLHPEFIREHQAQSRERARDLPRKTDVEDLLRLVLNPKRSATLRAIALTRLPIESNQIGRRQLMELAIKGHTVLRAAAIDRVANDPHEAVTELLLAIAIDSDESAYIRNLALLALEGRDPSPISALLDLFEKNVDSIQRQLVRTLSTYGVTDEIRDAFIQQHSVATGGVREQIELALRLAGIEADLAIPQRPLILDQWQDVAQQDGNRAAGHRVFRSTQIGCAKCHTINGLGGRLGPDLSHAGQSLSRTQIVQSIVNPSDQFPPQYQAWVVTTMDGRIFSGLQLDHKARGAIELFTTEGRTERFEAADIDLYEATPRSLMPDGLVDQMTVTEFRDLVTFLSSLK